MKNLGLEPTVLEQIKKLLAKHLPNAEVWAFGSRVKNTHWEASDIDLIARNPQDLSQPQPPEFFSLEQAFRESDIPLVVQILDWARIPEHFRDEIKENFVVIQSRA